MFAFIDADDERFLFIGWWKADFRELRKNTRFLAAVARLPPYLLLTV
jgi:hypothetical protein